MFPRRYFAGRYFTPRFFPESQGEEAEITQAGQRFCGIAIVTKRVETAAVVTKRVESVAVLDSCDGG